MYRNPVGKPCRQLAFPYTASNQAGFPVPRMSGPGAGTGTGQSIGSLQGTAGVLSQPALQGYTGIFAGSRRSSHGHEGDNQGNADIRPGDLPGWARHAAAKGDAEKMRAFSQAEDSARLTASGSFWITRNSIAAGPLTRRVPCSHLR